MLVLPVRPCGSRPGPEYRKPAGCWTTLTKNPLIVRMLCNRQAGGTVNVPESLLQLLSREIERIPLREKKVPISSFGAREKRKIDQIGGLLAGRVSPFAAGWKVPP